MRYDIVISCGLLAAGLASASYFHCVMARPTVISVKGVAEKIVRAEKCKLNIRITDKASKLEDLFIQRQKAKDVVLALLKKNSIDDREISFDSSIYFYEAKHNERTGIVEREAYYEDIIRFHVTTDKIGSIEAICKSQDELLANNIVASFTPDYKLKDFYGLKSQLVKEATKNAFDTAREMLEQTGDKVGALHSLSQGTVSIMPEDATSPYADDSEYVNKKLRLVVQASFKKK